MGAPTNKNQNRVERVREGPDTRLEMRVPPEQKRFFRRAAALRGVTLTDFAIATLQEAAVRTMEEHNLLRLAIQDQQVFVDALMNPPAPNDALVRAAKRYSRMVRR
jgi:uncharacterized protein (DUF1778 family)